MYKDVSLPIVFLFGPTAVGKTDLLSRISDLEIEVIVADSRQVYKDCVVASAAPDATLTNAVKHHFLHEIASNTIFSVADFVRKSGVLIDDILQRGKIPIVCGGTGFYIYHLINGLPRTPPMDTRIRKTLALRLQREGLHRLYQELKMREAERARAISPNDTYRVIRALEISYLSQSHVFPNKARNDRNVPSPIADKKYVCIGLYRSMEAMEVRIKQRIKEMMRKGLVEEARYHWEKFCLGEYGLDNPILKTIGYQEFYLHPEIRTIFTEQLESPISLTVLRSVMQQIEINTRRYVKRQFTFFKKIPHHELWLADDDERNAEKLRRLIGIHAHINEQ